MYKWRNRTLLQSGTMELGLQQAVLMNCSHGPTTHHV